MAKRDNKDSNRTRLIQARCRHGSGTGAPRTGTYGLSDTMPSTSLFARTCLLFTCARVTADAVRGIREKLRPEAVQPSSAGRNVVLAADMLISIRVNGFIGATAMLSYVTLQLALPASDVKTVGIRWTPVQIIFPRFFRNLNSLYIYMYILFYY